MLQQVIVNTLEINGKMQSQLRHRTCKEPKENFRIEKHNNQNKMLSSRMEEEKERTYEPEDKTIEIPSLNNRE